MPVVMNERTIEERALEALRRSGNPFRNFFARNPDDEVCSRYHVAELYAREREQLLAVVDLYRRDPTTHSEVVPVLGNKGAGKTHLLHSIKHGPSNASQLLITPGTFQKGADFLEYILFQLIDTLLGGGKQKGIRPLEFVGEALTRRLLRTTLTTLDAKERLGLFPASGLARWARRFGLGSGQAEERIQWLVDSLGSAAEGEFDPQGDPVRKLCQNVQLESQRVCDLIAAQVNRTEPRNTAGQLRRRIYQGFVRATLLGDEADLASFLTYGFAELEYHVRPTRQDLVLAVTKVLMEVFLTLRMPVVLAFDQLEDLLLVRRTDDGHKVSESFFAGIVQVMHQVDGICFLIFAERGLWNRFVPSLDGYIQDRLNNPVHLPKFGTIKALKLEAPPPQLVWQVVAARMKPVLEEFPDHDELSPIFPFTDEQITRIARTEPTLRDMLQQFRHLFDHMVYGSSAALYERDSANGEAEQTPDTSVREHAPPRILPPEVKSVNIVETAPARKPLHDLPDPHAWSVEEAKSEARGAKSAPRRAKTDACGTGVPTMLSALPTSSTPDALWDHAILAARAKLEPEGALTGATRELQAGLGALLQLCHEHGVKIDSWRTQHVVPDFSFGEHPTYGMLSIVHWTRGVDFAAWSDEREAKNVDAPRPTLDAPRSSRVGIGLFLGRGPGKPRDLQIKLSGLKTEPPVIDHLILLRPADDTALSGKSKAIWEGVVGAVKPDAPHLAPVARIEFVSLDEFAVFYGFPRWLAAVTESLPPGQPLPNLADLIQARYEKLLERVCIPPGT